MTAVIILEVVNKEKGVAGKYFDKKKVCLWTLITFSYRICVTITILEQLASQIEWSYESNLWSFGYFKCSRMFWFLLDPSCKGNSLTKSWLVDSDPDCYLTPKREHLQKNGSCIEILDDPGRRSKDVLPGHLFLDFFAKHFPNYLSLHYKKNVWPNLVRAAKQSRLKRCSKWYIRNCTKQCKYLHH